MIYRSYESSISLRVFLVLIALVFSTAATFLTFFFSSAATTTGSTPGLAISLATGTNTGILAAGERRWYRIMPNGQGERYQDLRFSMVYSSEGGAPQHSVNFELYTADEIKAWQQGGKATPNNFGAGMFRNNADVDERIWRGTVLRDGTYYLAIENGAESAVDYWLYDDDALAPDQTVKIAALLEPAPVAAPPDSEPATLPDKSALAQGITLQTALPAPLERTTGGLAPGQEIWYSFSVDNDTQAQFGEMALTMIVTPDDGNRIWNVNMEVFTADSVATWSPENNTAISNVGAGSVVYRDDNPLTGERFWSGWVVNNEVYYVRIINGAKAHIDYWLFNGDVYHPTLGE